MKEAIKILVALLTGVFGFYYSYAATTDSTATPTKPKRPSTKNDTWYHASEPEQHYVIDSSIIRLQNYNVIERDGREYINLGNTGTAAFPVVYDVDRSIGFDAGYNQFDLYKYTIDSVRYYQVIRPYTEISMMLGLNYEQQFKAKFANQYKNMVYYGVDFTRIFSSGVYQNQRANDNGFSLYAIYNSKNQRWNVRADLLFNLFKVQENGGVTMNPFDSTYFKKNLVPIYDTAENKYMQINFFLTSTYNVGKKYYERINDTLRQQKVLPVFRVSHQFNLEKSSFKYRDYYPDTLKYDAFYMPDSVYNDLSYFKFGNAFQLEYRPRKLTSDSTYEEKDFIAEAEAGFDYYLLTQDTAHHHFGNLYVGGIFRNNYASKPKIIYRASVKYYLWGYNQNDLLVDGAAGYNFGKIGILTGNATYEIKQAPYIYEHYDYIPEHWSYNLPKTKILAVGGKYQNPKYGVYADFNYYVADHLPTLPGSASPYVSTKVENAFVIHAGNRNEVIGIHFDNDIWYTIAQNNGYIKEMFPMLYTKHSLYYERRVFNGAFWFATGFDLRFRYKNNSPYYNALLGAFIPENQVLPTYPVLDFFFNFKIKTVRILLKVSNISSEFGPKGYFSAYNYPANDISFIAGVSWRFFE
ncbi:MAG TPA: putative porin [Chitinophagales bacterium]|nr:putative porin [Chitinophagales bacterium]